MLLGSIVNSFTSSSILSAIAIGSGIGGSSVDSQKHSWFAGSGNRISMNPSHEKASSLGTSFNRKKYDLIVL